MLFDAGLTLLRTATSTTGIACIVLERIGTAIDRQAVGAAMSLAEELVETRWQEGDWFASESAVRRLFVSSYAAGLKTLPHLSEDAAGADSIASMMYEEYGHPHHWALYPDVMPTVSVLDAADVVMGVVSDWGHGLEALLLELGLGRYLRFLVVSARLGVTKPDPSVFRMALDRIGVDGQAAVYVGDTYVKDVLGARAAGIIPVLLDRHGRAPDMDCPTIRSLTGLLPLIGLAPDSIP